MGIRGEIFSTKVILENRTYFFNVKENRTGDLYLNIVESKNRDAGGFERQSVILFADDTQEFLKAFDDSLRVLEKAVREQRRGSRRSDGDGESRDSGSRESRYGENRSSDRDRREETGGERRPAKKTFARRDGASSGSDAGRGGPPDRERRPRRETDDDNRIREYGDMKVDGSYGGRGPSRDSWGRRSVHSGNYGGRGSDRNRNEGGRGGQSRDSGNRGGAPRARRVVVRKDREKE